MWSEFRDARERRKKTWSETHIDTSRVFYEGSCNDILKKIRKKEDRKIFEFLLSYRSRKRKKQVSEAIIIRISLRKKRSMWSTLRDAKVRCKN
jgi:hypothetical protein